MIRRKHHSLSDLCKASAGSRDDGINSFVIRLALDPISDVYRHSSPSASTVKTVECADRKRQFQNIHLPVCRLHLKRRLSVLLAMIYSRHPNCCHEMAMI